MYVRPDLLGTWDSQKNMRLKSELLKVTVTQKKIIKIQMANMTLVVHVITRQLVKNIEWSQQFNIQLTNQFQRKLTGILLKLQK